MMILTLSRIFGVVNFVAGESGLGTMFLVYLTTPFLQMVLIKIGQRLLTSGDSTGLVFSTMGKGQWYFITGGYLLAIGCSAVFSLYRFGDFFAVNFYNGKHYFWLTLLFIFLVCLVVLHGIEGIGRGATVLFLLVSIGLVVLFATAVPQMAFRNLPIIQFSLTDYFTQAVLVTGVNTELFLLLLLSPYTTTGKIKDSAVWCWVIGITVLTAITAVWVSFALGSYTNNGSYPIFDLAQVAGVGVLPKLDSVLMGIWVIVGVIKIAVVIFFITELCNSMVGSEISVAGIFGTGLLIWLVAQFLYSVPKDIANTVLGFGSVAITIVGVILLPFLSKIFRVLKGDK